MFSFVENVPLRQHENNMTQKIFDPHLLDITRNWRSFHITPLLSINQSNKPRFFYIRDSLPDP